MTKIISVSLSPNTEKDDIELAWSFVFKPWQWKKGKFIPKLENKFGEMFNLSNCLSFNSGRSCLLAALSAIGLESGDEVILQSFTCNAVVNPILKFGGKPIYVDIGEDLNIAADKIEEKITPRTRVIIAQHTFGMPCDMDKIVALCQKHKLILIEDCAHALGAKINGQYCGTFGDMSFFSLGRDKVISSVYGGILAINNPEFLKKAVEFQEKLRYPKNSWTFSQLLHPILINSLVFPFYDIIVGKIFMALFINLGILSKAVTKNENQGILPDYFPRRLPNALAALALHQLEKLDKFNSHRKELAAYYEKELEGDARYKIIFKEYDKKKEPIFMKYPLLAKNPKEILNTMKANKIYLGDGWSDSAIMPPATSLEKMIYSEGSCSASESISKKIFSLPTHINIGIDDAKKIVYLLKR
jgi:perosamine synthetase